MCVAETRKGTVSLSFAMNSRKSGVPEQFKNNLYLQLSSTDWHFTFKEESLYFSAVQVFGAGNAWYFDDTIAFTYDDAGKAEIQPFAEDSLGRSVVISGDGKTMELSDSMIALDGNGQVIAVLSTKGLKEVYGSLLACAGVDFGLALLTLLPLAENGHSDAQFRLGILYEEGLGVTKDFAQAAKWYRLAAERNNPGAQNSLGNLYFDGNGVAKDPSEALNWYRKAAEQGDAYAQLNIGLMQRYAEGIPENLTEAVKWFSLAAEQGDATSQFMLGTMYAEGNGVTTDNVRAYFWLELAALADFSAAADYRDKLAEQMPNDERAIAMARVKEWQAAHPE